MTTLKAIERHYGVLTADERFRLVAQAAAGGDMAELRRLVDACPRLTYSMHDVAYGDRIRALADVLGAVLVVLQAHRAQASRAAVLARAAERYGGLAAELCAVAYRFGWEDGSKGNGPAAPDSDGTGGWWEGMADRWRDDLAAAGLDDWRAELAAWWRGADLWARATTGAGAGALVSGWYGDIGADLVTWADDAVATADDPDPAAVEAGRVELEDLWRHFAPDA